MSDSRYTKTVKETFEPGVNDGFDEYVGEVNAWIEHLANEVEKPCEIEVTIEVHDRDEHTGTEEGSDR